MNATEKTLFGSRIRLARDAAGMTQRAIADLIGVSQPRLSAWERGDAVPDTEQLLSLATALGVSVIDLLALEN